MDYEAGVYQKLPIKQYPARELGETAEGRYWRRFQSPATAKQVGAVSHIDFCPAYPYNFAVTSSTRVLIYDGATRTLKRTIGRFKDKAFSGSWRADGKLLVAGGQDGVVQLFDPGSRSLLRQFKAHKRPVHVTRFDPGRLHVLSGGDDATVRWWDVTAGKQVARWDGHTDYVRAAAVNPAAQTTWATGGYDHVCKVWDARSAQSVLGVDHGAPIEAVAFYPSGSLMVTAGGTEVKVWDLFSGGQQLACLSNHQKTVTCVALSPNAGPASAAAPRLLTGSLDGHIKVYELESFKVTHIQKYGSPILSLGLSGDAGLLAVGMADGTLTVRRHVKPRGDISGAAAPLKRMKYKPALTASTYRYFIRGQSSKAAAQDSVVAAERRAALGTHDRFLRRFRYRDALDAALVSRRPEVVASVVQELATRGGLASAIGSRDAAGLAPLLDHLRRHISDPRHSAQLAALAHRLLDAYAGSAALLGTLSRLQTLAERVELELRAQDGLARVKGMLGPLLAASMADDEERAAIAERNGYRQIGKDLPDDVTLVQVIKSMPRDVFDINPWRAWSAVGITLASVAASLYIISVTPWYLLPLAWALAGTAFTGFFVVGHDAGHRSFSKNRLLEDIVGTIMFAPLVYPFEPWRIKHNHHHAHTNKLEEDTAWHPLSHAVAAKWSAPLMGLYKFALGSPLKCWASLGHWLIWHFNAAKFEARQMPRVIVSWAAVAAFAGLVLPALVYYTGWTGLVKFWVMPWLGYHFWMSTFTVVHHTAQHIPFKPAATWNAAQAQLAGTVHCDYPWIVEFLCHDISVHVPHHVNAKIPWYNLRRANASLRKNWGEYMTECTFNWRMMKRIFTELHVYDEEQNYAPFDEDCPSKFLQAQRRILPERM